MNPNELKAQIVRKNMTMAEVAAELGINRSALWRKITEHGGKFDRPEIQRISELLELSPDETARIFFSSEVEKTQQHSTPPAIHD